MRKILEGFGSLFNWKYNMGIPKIGCIPNKTLNRIGGFTCDDSVRKPYRAISIAKWFVTTAENENRYLSRNKLIQLCFIAQGIYLANHYVALFSDSCQAWKMGATIRC